LISIEQKILASVSTLTHCPDNHQRLGYLLSQLKERDPFIQMTIRQGMAGLLYRHIQAAGHEDLLDRAQFETLRSFYYGVAAANIRRIHDLGNVLICFKKNSIPVVLLKGAILLTETYKDFGLRAMSDIDLWISKKNLHRVANILENYGYVRNNLYPGTFKKGTTIIDLRTHLLDADRIKSREMLLAGGQQALYHNTRPVDVEGNMALGLDPLDAVLFMGMHALKHNLDRFIWIADIRIVTEKWNTADWELLLRRADSVGQAQSVACMIYLMQQLFKIIPGKEIKEPGWMEKRVLKRGIRRMRLPGWAPLLLFTTGLVGLKRLRLIFEELFPRPHVLRQIFADKPDSNLIRLYLSRFRQISGWILAPVKRRLRTGQKL
jgi:hypothetical protein